MAEPFVVDDAFKKKISQLKVTELHTLLRNLGVSYQANKDQLVKRLILKYTQLYEQYTSGMMSFDDAKRFGDWINDGSIYIPSSPPLRPSSVMKPSPPTPTTSSRGPQKPQYPAPSLNTSYGAEVTYTGVSYNNNHHNSNNNHYSSYNNNIPISSYSSSSSSYYSSNGSHNYGSSPASKQTSNNYNSHSSTSNTSKTHIDVSYKPSTDALSFPKSVDPFLEIESTLVSQRLKPYTESRGRPQSVTFHVPDAIYSNIRSGAYRAIVRSFEVSSHTHVSLPHVWPPDCTLSVNGNYMALGIKKQTKPNAPPHPDKPLDISKEIRNGRNILEITTPSSRHYAVVIDAMRVISIDTLIDVVMKAKTMGFESAKKTVSLALGGDDTEIAALHTTVSLQCPLGRTPLRLPAKSLACRHIQCFDLRNYLMMNQRTPSWKCPVCSVPATTSNLIVDAYFSELLRNIDSETVSEVHINPSGDWSTVKPTKTAPKVEPTNSSVARAVSIVAAKPAAPTPPKPKRAVEVIDLLSDDDEPAPPKRAKIDSKPTSSPSSFSVPGTSPAQLADSTTTVPSISSPILTSNSHLDSTETISSPLSPSTRPSNFKLQRRSSISTASTKSTSSPIILPPLDFFSESHTPFSLPSPPETHLEPNLQSDLNEGSSVGKQDLKKKPSILVKLRAGGNGNSNNNNNKLGSPPLSSLSSPPHHSTHSEANGSFSSLEVPNLADPLSTGTIPRYLPNYNGHNDTHHHSDPSAPPSSSYSHTRPGFYSSSLPEERYRSNSPTKYGYGSYNYQSSYSPPRNRNQYDDLDDKSHRQYDDQAHYANSYHNNTRPTSLNSSRYNNNRPFLDFPSSDYPEHPSDYNRESYSHTQHHTTKHQHSSPPNHYNNHFGSILDDDTPINDYHPPVTHSSSPSPTTSPPFASRTSVANTTTTTTTTTTSTLGTILGSANSNGTGKGSSEAQAFVISDDSDEDGGLL